MKFSIASFLEWFVPWAVAGPLLRQRAKAARAALYSTLLLLLSAAWPIASAQTAYQESEPNNPCTSAQSMVSAPLPLQIQGYKTYDPQAVDFYKFYGLPGSQLTVKLEPDNTKPQPLNSLLVGLFSANCPASPWVSTAGFGGSATIATTVPAEGFFVVAVTACCDFSFSGSGTLQGAYILSVNGVSQLVRSIGGKVVDKVTGVPLSGLEDPFAVVSLERLTSVGWEVAATSGTREDGTYLFTNVPTGRYRVSALASQYQTADNSLDLGPVGANEDRAVPALGLNPNPVRFTDIRPCDAVPPNGGACNYSFRATLGADRMRSGIVWSVVSGTNTGGVINSTQFQSCELPLTLVAGTPTANQVVRCGFQVPANVPDGAMFCLDARFGDGSRIEPHIAVQGMSMLFCMAKLLGAQLQVLPRATSVQRLRQLGGRLN